MRILPIQDVYQRKFKRQKRIKGLQYHAAGHCVHIGKISFGCYGCFVPDKYRKNIRAGERCMCNCIYCTSTGYSSDINVKEERRLNNERFKRKKYFFVKESLIPDYSPTSISFSGGGEPLMYIDNIDRYMRLFHTLHKNLKRKPWYYLYTNGMLANERNLERLKALGFDEIRFHLGATDFSEKVYSNMRQAMKHFKTVSVETPAWPFHKEKLFEMLPRIQDIGVKHLNITEVEINANNFERISKLLPNGEICQCGELQLYDEGLVYDLMEEVIRKGFTYSVLDCNCFVKSIQRTEGKWIYHEDVTGLCAE